MFLAFPFQLRFYSFGYPDETYFVRVRAELEEAGITEDLLTEEDQQETEFPVSNAF